MNCKFLARGQLIEKCPIGVICSNTKNLNALLFQLRGRSKGIFAGIWLTIGDDYDSAKVYDFPSEVKAGCQVGGAAHDSNAHCGNLFLEASALYRRVTYHRGPIGKHGEPCRISATSGRFGEVDSPTFCL